jgi:hypothetical protein
MVSNMGGNYNQFLKIFNYSIKVMTFAVQGQEKSCIKPLLGSLAQLVRALP